VTRKITIGSLFAGIGGIELGLERTGGFETVWQLENNEYATRVLETHWPAVRRWGDVRTFLAYANFGCLAARQAVCARRERVRLCRENWRNDYRVDLICGGFPCQPVSTAGKRRGEADERWLWPAMRRVCAVLRPTWVLVENVPGLLSAKDVCGKRGALFGRVVRDLAALGYRVRWDCIPAAAVGAPHIRERVFIVGHAASTRAGTITSESRPRDTACESGGDVAYANGTWQLQQEGGQPAQRRRAGNSGGEVPDALQERCNWGSGVFQTAEPSGLFPSQGSNPWSIEPDVGRVANGVSSRVDRLRCLGNAVVPQVAKFIGHRILTAFT